MLPLPCPFTTVTANPLPNRLLGQQRAGSRPHAPADGCSFSENQTIADAASAANDVAGALATPSIPELQVRSLLPPGNEHRLPGHLSARPVAYEYSNMTTTATSAGTSLPPRRNQWPGVVLGIQTGIVLLKTSKNIASIKVNGRSLSAWNNPPTSPKDKDKDKDNDKDKDKENKLFLVGDRPIGTISLPSTGNIDFDNISSLAMFSSPDPKVRAMNHSTSTRTSTLSPLPPPTSSSAPTQPSTTSPTNLSKISSVSHRPARHRMADISLTLKLRTTQPPPPSRQQKAQSPRPNHPRPQRRTNSPTPRRPMRPRSLPRPNLSPHPVRASFNPRPSTLRSLLRYHHRFEADNSTNPATFD